LRLLSETPLRLEATVVLEAIERRVERPCSTFSAWSLIASMRSRIP
jgi:hypothetical protein